MVDVSIIIVSHGTKNILRQCLLKIYSTRNEVKKETIIVDNNSSDGTREMIKKEFHDIELIENKTNAGFARAVIQGGRIAKGKYILLLNPDTFIKEDTIGKTIRFMEDNPGCGVLGLRLVDVEGKLQPSARYFPTPWRLFLSCLGVGYKIPNYLFLRGMDDMRWDHRSIREIDWVPGCYFLTRKKIIDEIGFFDARYYLYYEEIDFCLRAKKAGWKVIFYPDADVIHLGGESAKREGKVTIEGRQLERFKLQSEFIYFRKNYGIFYVFLDLCYIFLFDIIGVLKKIILHKKDIRISKKLEHLRSVYHILISTKFGLISND